MSDQFYIGYIEGNNVTKIFDIPGSSTYALRDLLEHSNINIWNDFNYFATDDRFDPLFYYMDDESRLYAKDNFGEPEDIQKVIDFKGGYWKSHTVICDGEIKDGITLHIKEEDVKKPNYQKFKNLEINKDNINLYVSEKDMKRGYSFLEDLIAIYIEVIKWIGENKTIFWQKYL